MLRKIMCAILSAVIIVSCCGTLFASATETNSYATGGLWQSPDEFAEDCGATLVDCSEIERNTRSPVPSSFDIATNSTTATFFPPN